MSVPVSQMATVALYLAKQKLRGRKRYPLALMLEPLYRCNLACAGCGKIQYPSNILKTQLSYEDCMKAVDECPAPVVSIPGGEPLLHPEIDRIVRGLIERKKYIYLCTNALLLEEKIHLFEPSKYLSFSVHLDGLEKEHDESVCRDGVSKIARAAIQRAIGLGFRVTTNTTLFDGADPKRTQQFFDEMMELGVEGMMVSPGYSYQKAPDQGHFLGRERTKELFRKILHGNERRWQFNQSVLFLEFLAGGRDYDCTPWGNPTYSVFGWQKPCYLLQDGYADSFQQMMDETQWQNYGPSSGNPHCRDCMVHSGFEASAVEEIFSSFRGLMAMLRAAIFGPAIPEPKGDPAQLLQIATEIDSGPAEREEAEESGPGQGWSAPASMESLRVAFEYRGDVTLLLDDDSRVDGYLSNLSDDAVRLWCRGETDQLQIPIRHIKQVELSGRDTASGKSWQTWVKKREAAQAAATKAAASV
ncbi:MAG: adenosyl-hopene transferase HpnH [Deltaproteobacteria bacterium]|nr:adenosyl-hopene transferase HpnH [Deltaproteobacteria bacterium]